jgi:hypothetical protein
MACTRAISEQISEPVMRLKSTEERGAWPLVRIGWQATLWVSCMTPWPRYALR